MDRFKKYMRPAECKHSQINRLCPPLSKAAYELIFLIYSLAVSAVFCVSASVAVLPVSAFSVVSVSAVPVFSATLPQPVNAHTLIRATSANAENLIIHFFIHITSQNLPKALLLPAKTIYDAYSDLCILKM